MEKINDKLLNWASVLDEQTRTQAETSSQMAFIYPHLALMPDAHLGKGATVGSVIPTLGAVMPAAVGVDIGCGMMALATGVSVGDLPDDRRALREAIERAVPLSPGNNNTVLTETADAHIAELETLAQHHGFDPAAYAPNWRLQLGSLGGGNHFIEVSRDQDANVWLFLHSGSRGVGNKIAMHHIEVAHAQCTARGSVLPHRDLAYLSEGEPKFDRYIAELSWAQEFARRNRVEMMTRVQQCFQRWLGRPVQVGQEVNCHHNYTVPEQHYGQQVWLSRKGAISARQGQWGLIPGSMGTRSYVVRGLGNEAALCSAPHGAGRVYSRTAARKAFTLEDLRTAMGQIEFRDLNAFVDEIPAAYKDIDQVMRDSAELVEIVYTLSQLVNVKGQ